MLMDDIHQFFKQQEIGRNDTQARTDHDAVISASCERIGKHRFRSIAPIDVQRLNCVAERFQLCLIRLYRLRTFAAVSPGTGDLL